MLLNRDATKQRIMSAITDMVRQSQKKPLDHVIFMFAGHGLPPNIKSTASNAFLAPFDAQIITPKGKSAFFKESGGLVNNETFINKAWLNFSANIPEVQVLLQVHDSLAGQFPTFMRDTLLPKMAEQSKILIPYADPLIIPTGIKTSTVSWGDCE